MEVSGQPGAVGIPQQGAEESHLLHTYCENLENEQEKPSQRGTVPGD